MSSVENSTILSRPEKSCEPAKRLPYSAAALRSIIYSLFLLYHPLLREDYHFCHFKGRKSVYMKTVFKQAVNGYSGRTVYGDC